MATKTEKPAEKDEQKTAIEQFMEMDGSDLVIAPTALGSAKRMRAFALLVGMTSGKVEGVDDLDYAAMLNGTADAIDWMVANAAKDKAAFIEFIDGIDFENGMNYVMTYLSAVGEM